MIKILKFADVTAEEVFARSEPTSDVSDVVTHIIEDVRLNGDRAIIRYAARFDGIDPEGFELELTELDVTALTADILMSFYDDITERGEEPVVDMPEEPVHVMGNKEAYTRVVQNIIKTALVHGKNLKVSLKREGNEAVFDRFY